MHQFGALGCSAEMAEPIQVLFTACTRIGPSNPVLHGVLIGASW